MRKGIFLFVILTIAPSSSALGQTADSKTATNRTAEQELLRMERDWTKAVVDRNPSVIARIQANDFIGWDFEGKAYTKSENIQALENGYWNTISLDLDDVKARVFADTAVVTSRVTRKGRFKDQDLTGQFRWTRVYAKRCGGWELVAQQSSRIGDAVPSFFFPSEAMDNVAAQPSATGMNREESQVREVENELTNALVNGDASTLNRLYGADYIHTGPDGALSGKGDRVAEFRSGSRQFRYLKRDDVQIRMYPMAAVVTDVDTVQGTFKGKEISGRARAMRVWVKQRDGWQLVAAHATALTPSPLEH
jgi:ketosteroid isomerase-like protein